MGVEGRTATAPQDDGILYIGLDLGTSQSSIVTSSDVRKTATSVVGWPKDLISYKFLQKQVVIGDECLENRMAVDMIWPLEHGVFKYGPSDDEEDPAPESDREAEAIQHLISYTVDMAEAERRVRETEIRIDTLRQELDEKQRQRAETTEHNATLAERSSELEKRLGEMAQSVQHCEDRIRDLEDEKSELQKDLNKIMGNLTRW